MAYHTGMYLFLFLPAVLLLYQGAPARQRWKVLLLAGYAFFYLVSGKLLLYLLGTTLFTHYIGLWLEALQSAGRGKREQKRVLAFGICVLLAVLGYLKYYNFFAENLNKAVVHFGGVPLLAARHLLLPIGISFYTLQAIGYMADIYWKKIPAGQPLGKVALFLGFFPQIMEGPISMYGQTADQLWQGRGIRREDLSRGWLRIVWGLFKKMVIADRLYVLVQNVFSQHSRYSGVIVAVAAVAYTVQLYMEFSGCMDIVTGSARMFGVTLPENFRQPFVSRSAAEFWRRWHITLGVWLKTYVFYPVSASGLVKRWNRFARKHCGKYASRLGVSALALFPVWLCNGLWHGPRWSYIFYGMYYFVILLLELAFEPVGEKIRTLLGLKADAWQIRAVQIFRTWLVVFTGELFFRADGLRAGIEMFRSIFRGFSLAPLWDGSLCMLGLDLADYLVVFAGCLAVGVAGFFKERQTDISVRLENTKLPVRWACYYALILAVVLFGAYGIGYQKVDLIYAGF